jgi:GR25 family glycosyltransferase involved in LPS biosynthesis
MKDWIKQYFDKVYVIALPERLSYMTTFINVKARFFPPYLAKDLNQENLIQRGVLSSECDLTRGQVACHLSHCGVLSEFLKDPDADTCLVFEDDVIIPDDTRVTQSYFKTLMGALPEDWDILYLGRCWDACTQDIPVSPTLVKCFQPLCRHAIAFTRRGAERVLEMTLPIHTSPGDRMISALIETYQLNAYCAKPGIFVQDRVKFDSSLRIKTSDTPRECRDEVQSYEFYVPEPKGRNYYNWLIVIIISYLFYRHFFQFRK